MFPFRSVLVAGDRDGVDLELLAYTADLLKGSPATAVTVAARPALRELKSFSPRVHSVFAARGVREVSCRYLPEPDWEEVCEVARQCAADLIIARSPLASRPRGAPCALWLAPLTTPALPRRIVAAIGLDASGRKAMEAASAVAWATGATELIALHVFRGPVLDPRHETTERLCEERKLDLYCLTARVDGKGLPCLLEVAESLNPPAKAARFAEDSGAGLVVSAPEWIDPRIAERVALLLMPYGGFRRLAENWIVFN
jgi:hypothetical protein